MSTVRSCDRPFSHINAFQAFELARKVVFYCGMRLGVLWRSVPDTLERLSEDQFRAKELQIRAAFHVLDELTQFGGRIRR